ncbi:MAG: hypothetical protein V3U10_04225 [Bacteroidota bacterium]
MQADSAHFPSLIFGASYALYEEDTLEAQLYFARAKQVDGIRDLVHSLETIFSYSDSLRQERLTWKRSAYYVRIGRAYESMGLEEMEIGQMLQLLREDPDHVEGCDFWRTCIKRRDAMRRR